VYFGDFSGFKIILVIFVISKVFLLFSSFLDYLNQFRNIYIYQFGECCKPIKHRNNILRKSH
jgi:hypothetical protein